MCVFDLFVYSLQIYGLKDQNQKYLLIYMSGTNYTNDTKCFPFAALNIFFTKSLHFALLIFDLKKNLKKSAFALDHLWRKIF
jgi:hypothetical protein